ncbi:hypothetical protein CsSME_00044045 [Camellia sinensis var. sinensis]
MVPPLYGIANLGSGQNHQPSPPRYRHQLPCLDPEIHQSFHEILILPTLGAPLVDRKFPLPLC